MRPRVQQPRDVQQARRQPGKLSAPPAAPSLGRGQGAEEEEMKRIRVAVNEMNDWTVAWRDPDSSGATAGRCGAVCGGGVLFRLFSAIVRRIVIDRGCEEKRFSDPGPK